MVLQLSKSLVKEGHEVEVFCSDSSKTEGSITPLNEVIEGIKVSRFRTWLSLSYFHKFYPGVFFKLLSTDFDIIHVQGIRKVESYFALLAAKLKGKKVIISTHNPFVVDENERSSLSNLYIKLHDVTFGFLFLKFFDKFLTLSKEEDQQLDKFGVSKDKIKVIPNAVPNIIWEKGDTEKIAKRYKINISNWQAIVLSLGRITRRKGLQNLKKSIDTLSDTLFVMAGPDDGYVSKLKELFGNAKNVKFLGSIERSETKDVFSLCDIFILPSLYEPFGIVLIEAMAKGKPVIATKIGGPKEIVKSKFGYLVDPTDQTAIKEKIEYLVKNKNVRQKMGNEALREAKKYSWNIVFNMYLNVYNNLLRDMNE